MTALEIVRSPTARAIAGAALGLIGGLLVGWDARRPVPPPGPGMFIALLIFAVFLTVGWWVVNRPLPVSLSRLAKGFLSGGVVGLLVSVAMFGLPRDAVVLSVVLIATLVFSQSEISDPLPSHDRTSQRRP